MSKLDSSCLEPAPPLKSASAIKPYCTMQDAHEAYFLGVDGGGTHTRALITDSTHRILGEGQSGASNPVRVGLAEALVNLELAVRDACVQAGIEVGDLTAACFALAGVSHPIHYEVMKEQLDEAFGIGHLKLITDASAALTGALDGKPGVIVIAGTGSIAMGINGAGEEARSGGLGPLLSDEGSGYDIARQALRAVIASFDGRQPETRLTRLICERLGVTQPADLPGVLYNSDCEKVEIASLAELVSQAAQAGDPVASSLLRKAGEELGALAVSVIRKLHLQDQTFRVACIGSVFNAEEFVLTPLRQTILQVAPQAEIGKPLFPPTIGAVKIAQQWNATMKE